MRIKIENQLLKERHAEVLASISQYCPNCGVPVTNETSKFCGLCFTKLKSIYETKN